MLTKTVIMVVRDEEFYIDMCLESILPYIDNLYILDTGSKDKTIEIIKEFSIQYPDKIILEEKDFGGDIRFGIGYKELEARNYALSRSKELFNPDWIICMDADEVYNEKFFNILDNLGDYRIIGHATETPTSPYSLDRQSSRMTKWSNYTLYDPHVRVWNNKKINVIWEQFPNRHVILSEQSSNIDLHYEFIIPEPVHFHLHFSFGPKYIHSWLLRDVVNHDTSRGLPDISVGKNDTGLLVDIGCYDQDYYTKNYAEFFDSGGKFTPDYESLIFIIRNSILISKNVLPNVVTHKWDCWGNWPDKETVINIMSRYND